MPRVPGDYIQSPAKLLPIDASPYEDGAVKDAPERLLERLWKGERLLILGEPGMGKTVALERLAWELASNDPLILPILVALRDYDGGALLDWVRLSIVSVGEIKLKSVEETIQFFERIPFEVYFLLDGLNEVAPAHREKILGEIKRLSMEFPHARLVVSSRVQDEGWRSLRQSDAVRETSLIQPISPEQTQRYLAAHLNTADCEALWNRLDDRMKGLAGTPLLLWLIKEAWLESHNVPGNRGALYGNFVTRMLRRDDERKIGTGVPEKTRLDALERLALKMHEVQVIALSAEQVEVIIPDAAVLAALRVNGLLTGDKIIRFAPHQTVQEHFAARAIRAEAAQKVRSGAIGQMLTGHGVLIHARESWWAETFIQLAGLTDDPNALARAVAAVNPWLAWWCVQDGKAVDEDTQRVIEAKSINLVRSARVSDRRAAAQALAKLNSERVIPPLATLSIDVEKDVRQIALSALLVFGEPGQQVLFEKCITAVQSQQVNERHAAAQALAKLNSERVIPPLATLSVDADGDVSRAALSALLGFGEAGQEALGKAFEVGFSKYPPMVRAGWGRAIDHVDPRPGVLDFDWDEDCWCLVPKGDFSYQGKPDKIDYDFWIARYPVTYGQFQLFVDDNPEWWQDLHKDGREQQLGGAGEQRFKFWNHPRENVSWYEAVAFCRCLNALTLRPPLPPAAARLGEGVKYQIRLPLETEWEKAASWDAKAKKARVYPWGDTFDPTKANTREGERIGRTTAVGIYPQGASPCGALDMSGNVWEWCLNEYSSGEVNIGSNDLRGMRGGSWLSNADRARAACRSFSPYFRSYDLGFRVVLAPVSLGLFSDH
ncbi:MAG: SUMF1/EgtB/PvdO family nonheme iron enzyme [Anaerolineae bacterium]|nr:SUMF1/EgtB/PvdO family nonheme iron enzyme [Anaerolineae bacterium]